jgi:hypothetical protein
MLRGDEPIRCLNGHLYYKQKETSKRAKNPKRKEGIRGSEWCIDKDF